MRGVTLFSGLGGVDAGMKLAGITPVGAVELDPERPGYSEACREAHERNFPESEFLMNTVQETDWGVIARLRPDAMHASLVCSNYCPMSELHGKKENREDREMAIAVADGIESVYPDYFSLEQAPEYVKSGSFRIIRDRLEVMGYEVKITIADMAYFSVPQHRKRMFALCWKSGKSPWKFPETSRVVGWKEAIAGVEVAERGELTKKQKERLDWLGLEGDLLIQRISASKKLVVRQPNQPCWAILRDHFNDNKGGIRSKVISARIGSEIYNLPIRAIARLCSFPDWFWLPLRYAGMGLGYAVPPLMMKKIYQQLP